MTSKRPRIVIASQEVWPFVPGGGIGRHVSEVAALLVDSADVTVLTEARWRADHERLAAAGDPRLLAGVRYAWVDDAPVDTSPFHSAYHFASYSFWRGLRELAREGPIDLVEFEDYRGIGAVSVDAKRTGAPELAETLLAVGLHTSWETTAVLDGQARTDLASRSAMALERLSLRFADRLMHPSARTYAAYRRFYGVHALASGTLLPPAFLLADQPVTEPPVAASDRLRLLYVGRLQELKGVVNLVRGVLALDDPDIELTLVGRDTPTAPAGGSMLDYLRRLVGDDPRVRFHGSAERDELDSLIDSHHVVVVPSRFESYGYVVREGLARNRPVLATPEGGIVQGFVVGRSGWLTSDASPEALTAAIGELAAHRGDVDALIAAGAPRATLEQAIDTQSIVEGYHALARSGRKVASPSAEPRPAPVTAVVLAMEGDGRLDLTLSALESQEDVEIETVVVTHDPARVRPRDLARLHRLVIVPPGSGRAEARRAALVERAGVGPVLLVSAGHEPASGFLARGIAALAAPASPAYVTAHGIGRDPANAPLGNAVVDLLAEFGMSGEVSLVRSEALADGLPDGSDQCDDQAFFRELAAAGLFGAVVPEPLIGAVRTRCRSSEAAARAMAVVASAHELWDPA